MIQVLGSHLSISLQFADQPYKEFYIRSQQCGVVSLLVLDTLHGLKCTVKHALPR
jgi:hypothetical protein